MNPAPILLGLLITAGCVLLFMQLCGCMLETPQRAVRIACVETLDGGVVCALEGEDCYVLGQTLACPKWRGQ